MNAKLLCATLYGGVVLLPVMVRHNVPYRLKRRGAGFARPPCFKSARRLVVEPTSTNQDSLVTALVDAHGKHGRKRRHEVKRASNNLGRLCLHEVAVQCTEAPRVHVEEVCAVLRAVRVKANLDVSVVDTTEARLALLEVNVTNLVVEAVLELLKDLAACDDVRDLGVVAGLNQQLVTQGAERLANVHATVLGLDRDGETGRVPVVVRVGSRNATSGRVHVAVADEKVKRVKLV